MADITDIKTVLTSALGEISVTGTLEVAMDGAETVSAIGEPTGDDVEVLVVVRPAQPHSAPAHDPA